MPAAAEHQGQGQAKGSPTILVVEDEPLVRIFIVDYLQDCGFKTLSVATAAEAIEVLEKSGMRFDVVFTDIYMPGPLNGFDLARWVRKNRPGLPVLLASGDAKKAAAAEELCEEGPILQKPYDLKQVIARIRAIIDAGKMPDKE